MLSGCSGFVPVRSGAVQPGAGLDIGVTVATPPGDEAAWFYSFDCADACDHAVPALSLGARFGSTPEKGAPFEIGVGLSGFFPYLDGYVQLKGDKYPAGVGARLGLTRGSWYEDVIYVAYDMKTGMDRRVFMTSSLFRHAGTSPNGASRGSVLAVAHGIGVEMGGIVPSVALAVGRVGRSSDYRPPGSSGRPVTRVSPTAFVVVGISGRIGGKGR